MQLDLESDCSHTADFSNLVLQHFIGLRPIYVEHLQDSLNPSRRNFDLKSVPWARLPAFRPRVGIGKIFGHQPKLDQDCCLIPANVFMIQTISANIHNRGEGDS